MAIDESLLQILVCPDDKTPVSLADAALVADINSKISLGTAKNRAGQVVKEKIDGGLLRRDGKILYPIRDDIPVMLVEEGIELL